MTPNEVVQRAFDRYIIETRRTPTHIFVSRALWDALYRSLYFSTDGLNRGVVQYHWHGYQVQMVSTLEPDVVLVGHVLAIAEAGFETPKENTDATTL